MRIHYLFITLICMLFGGGISKENNAEVKCNNFQLYGIFYPRERVTVNFNSEVIYDHTFIDKNYAAKAKSYETLHRFCVAYTDTFKVDLKIIKEGRTIKDTCIIGLAKNGKQLLRVPYGDPKPYLLDKVLADTTGAFYSNIPPDSLTRRARLETGLIINDY